MSHAARACTYAVPKTNLRVERQAAELLRSTGKIESLDLGALAITVRDKGVGLPADFEVKTERRLGMRLVNAFTHQLHAKLEVVREYKLPRLAPSA